MQIKITFRFHLAPARMAKGKIKTKTKQDKRTQKNKATINVSIDAGKGDTYLLLVGVKTGSVTMEISVGVPQRVKNRSVALSIYTTLGHMPPKPYILP